MQNTSFEDAVVQIMIQRGADLYAADGEGRTAYDLALAAGEHGCAAILQTAMEENPRDSQYFEG